LKIEIGTNLHYKKESKVKVKEMNDLTKYGSWEKVDEFTDDSSDISSEEVNDPQENRLEPSTPPTIQDNFLEEGEVQEEEGEEEEEEEEEERFDTPPAIRSLGRRAGQPRKRKQSMPKKFQPNDAEKRQDYINEHFYTKAEFEYHYMDGGAHWEFQHPRNILRRQYIHDIIYYNPTLSNRKLDLLIDKMIAYAC
jgi:hypothetical protein